VLIAELKSGVRYCDHISNKDMGVHNAEGDLPGLVLVSVSLWRNNQASCSI
jgi:hypothetical protein